MAYRRRSRRLMGPVVLVALAVWIGNIGATRAAELGGQFGIGAGWAFGETHSGGVNSDAGGLGVDISARFSMGPAVVGATALMLPSLFGTSELVALGGAGAMLPLGGRWRLTSMLELGAHAFYGLGDDFLASSEQGGSATLPCWGARLSFEEPGPRPMSASFGLSLFFLADLTAREQNVLVDGIGGSSRQRHHVGGTLAGVMVRVLFGS